MRIKTGLGQDSHRFESKDSSKPCIIAGVHFEDVPGFMANSDGDVVYHAICNAITSITGILILGGIADELCSKDGITNSEFYLTEGYQTLKDQNFSVSHVAVSLEAKKPSFKKHLLEMRKNIAKVLEIKLEDVGITATSGEGLTDCGCGDGVNCLSIITVMGE